MNVRRIPTRLVVAGGILVVAGGIPVLWDSDRADTRRSDSESRPTVRANRALRVATAARRGQENGGGTRGAAPLSASARSWIRENRVLIHETAERLSVSPLALAGVVAAERTLLHDHYDSIVDALFRAYFAKLSEEQLRSWVTAQEAAYQRRLRDGGDLGLRMVKTPYLWSIGPAQVSFRNALFYEPRLARLQDREKRTIREIVQALLSAEGSLEYAAVILREAEEAYARYADLDLSERPGVLATLYHLGSPARRALRLEEENRRRELRGEITATPRVNFYGEFVEYHAVTLETLLR